MDARLPVLDTIRVATPCTASWEQMTGDDKKRFCGQCKLHVHDFSAMTEGEITQLLEQANGRRVCGRFYRRADGTVLTQDCPVGLAALRRKVARAVAAVAAAVVSAVGVFAFLRSGSARDVGSATAAATAAPVTSITEVEPIKSLCQWIAPRSTIMMGEIVYVPPPGSSGQTGGGP